MGSPWGPQSSLQLATLPSPAPQLIYMHWMNTVVNYCGPFEYEVGYCERLKSFLEANLEWMQEEMEVNKDSAYWHQVGAAATLSGVGRRVGSAVGARHRCGCCSSSWWLTCLWPLLASPLVCPSSPSLPADLPFIRLSNLPLSSLLSVHWMELQLSILSLAVSPPHSALLLSKDLRGYVIHC